jgi:hypothetical protein
MTLVVARKVGARIGIVSDTRLTLHSIPLQPQNGVIKSCMLPGHICVSFNNSPDLAAKEFLQFIVQYPTGTTFAAAIRFFINSSRTTGNDYIVAFSKPPKIVRIRNGEQERSLSNTLWIGDEEAYERFKEYEAKRRNAIEIGRAINSVFFFDTEGSPTQDLYSTMRNVVSDPLLVSVGGFVTSVVNWDEGFRYSVYSDVLYNWPEGKDETYAPSLSDKINLGASDENEDVSISQISTSYIGLNIVAYYVLRARKVFVFHMKNSPLANGCVVISDVEPEDLDSKLSQLSSTNLNWLIFINSAVKGSSSPRTGSASLSTENADINGIQIPFIPRANTLGRKIEDADKHVTFSLPFGEQR